VPKPYYVAVTHDLIIGREMHAASGAMLDLSELDAFNMGVSRRHAMLRRTDSGFELLDLFSRNGTWLNSVRLSPNKPYAFESGSQIRLGRMHLVIAYHVRVGERVR
jgi:pSer/pThr/pTyr-binding forkhead associated (FHA) protein